MRILHRNMLGLGLPLITIALVQGEALGGGFESILSFDVVIAERDARFGLPEAMFGLFPGMGAHSFLSRRLGSAQGGGDDPQQPYLFRRRTACTRAGPCAGRSRQG